MPHSRSWQPLARRLQGRRSSRVGEVAVWRSSCVAIRYSRWLPFLSWTFNQSWVCSVQRSCLEQVAEGAAGLSPGGDGGQGYCQALASPVRLCRRLEVAAVGAVGDHFWVSHDSTSLNLVTGLGSNQYPAWPHLDSIFLIPAAESCFTRPVTMSRPSFGLWHTLPPHKCSQSLQNFTSTPPKFSLHSAPALPAAWT